LYTQKKIHLLDKLLLLDDSETKVNNNSPDAGLGARNNWDRRRRPSRGLTPEVH
jgi:hypothetical protein